MASTRFLTIGVVLFVVALSVLEAYQWDRGPEDKAKISACLGGRASLPWSIVTGDETILNTEWSFQAPDKKKTTIATYRSKHFYTTDDVRIGFLPNAGLSLRYARPQDSGNYSVQVQLQRSKSSELVFAERTATLSFTDLPPATQDGDLYVTLSDAVRDDVTQDWTLQLHCGQFVDLGHPPVDVVWKTPSGEVKNSNYQDNGTFVLSVSSPVQRGKYYCQLPPSAPAVRCLTTTSPLNAAALLYVDDKDVRLSFLEVRQREQDQTIKDQAKLLQRQLKQILQQNETVAELKAKLVEMKQAGFTPANCTDWLKVDPRSAIQTVFVSREPITVYCDQTTDNGGWIVFQRRQDTLSFDRNWTEYRNGFGDLEGSFWLGLDKIHKLTTSNTSQKYELRVDMHKWDGTKGYATYSDFRVEDESQNFTLRYDKFTGGNAGHSMGSTRDQPFSTPDRDNDGYDGKFTCSGYYRAGWWFRVCGYTASLNGKYKTSGAPSHGGITWSSFGGHAYSLKFVEMKFRPN